MVSRATHQGPLINQKSERLRLASKKQEEDGHCKNDQLTCIEGVIFFVKEKANQNARCTQDE